jgi:hypothetical protein
MIHTKKLTLVSLVAAVLASGCAVNAGNGTGAANGGIPGCPSATYVGDLHGAPATAKLSAEVLVETTYVGGTIESASAFYSFKGELGTDPYTKQINDSGFADVLDHNTNQRFRAKLTFHGNGFEFLANPFEGTHTTAYRFVCQ